jgi:hypothetical protein
MPNEGSLLGVKRAGRRIMAYARRACLRGDPYLCTKGDFVDGPGKEPA